MMRSRSQQQSHSCPMCSRTFSSPAAYFQHVSLHSLHPSSVPERLLSKKADEKRFKCRRYGKLWRSPSHLVRHMWSKCYKAKYRLSEHYQSQHAATADPSKHENPRKNTLQCSVCLKSPSSCTCLSADLRVLSGEQVSVPSLQQERLADSSSVTEQQVSKKAGKKRFKCEQCGKLCCSPSKLARHRTVHTREKVFKCVACTECFVHQSGLSRHQFQCHPIPNGGREMHSCEQCGKTWRCLSSLQRHMTVHTGVRAFKCEACSKCFKDNAKLLRHCRTLHAATADPSPVGRSRTTNSTRTGKTFRCSECLSSCTCISENLRNPSSEQVSLHSLQPELLADSYSVPKRQVSKKVCEMRFGCESCGKLWSSRSHLQRHMTLHTKEKAFKCDACSKCFTQKHWLSRHRNQCHLSPNVHQKLLKCRHCKKSWRDAAMLRRHMPVHAGARAFKCDTDSKCCKDESALSMHNRLHQAATADLSSTGRSRNARPKSAGKKFQCSLCLKCLSNRACLSEHMRIHSGERPFQCRICTTRFRFRGSLKVHTRLHTGERPYQCAQCGKRFAASGALSVHRRSHSDERLFGCQLCPLRFKLRSYLKEHQRRLHAS